MEILIVFVLMAALAPALFWFGPGILSVVVEVGEGIEEKVAEWKRIFRALRNGED